MTRFPTLLVAVLMLPGIAPAQLFPDMMYYKFDEGSGTMTANLANPGVGSTSATVNGAHALGAAGQFAGGLFAGGGTGTTDFVDTGWVTALGGGSWTISMYLDITAVTANPFGYFFGDNTASSFRAFTNGAAGTGNVILRGPITDVIITGGANQSAPQVVTWAHDATAGVIRGYLNGALVSTVAQGPLNINGTANFKVAGYATTTGLMAGSIVDEFRMYGRALTDPEVAATWNVELFDQNQLSITQSGPGVGDLMATLQMISPTASEGYTAVTSDTSGVQGTGPFFGILPDAYTWSVLMLPYAPGNPFHFGTGDPGVFPQTAFTLAPGSLSSLTGQTLDFVCILLQPGFVYDSRSNVERVAFQ